MTCDLVSGKCIKDREGYGLPRLGEVLWRNRVTPGHRRLESQVGMDSEDKERCFRLYGSQNKRRPNGRKERRRFLRPASLAGVAASDCERFAVLD